MSLRFARIHLLLSIAGLPAVAIPLHSQQPSEGTRVRINAAEITLTGRVQAQFNTTSVDGTPRTEYLLRRVRFGADVRINDVVSGRIQPEFVAGGVVGLADAYVQLNLSPALQLLGGRTHRPFALMEQMSTLQAVPVERGLRVRGADGWDLASALTGLRYSDRDVGIQLRGVPPGAPLSLTYAFGMFGGPLQGASGPHTTQQFVARTTVAPVANSRVGAAWSRRDFSRPVEPGALELSAGDAFALDLEIGSPTPRPGAAYLVAEVARAAVDPFTRADLNGGHLWLGYRIAATEGLPFVEPLIRISHTVVDPAPGRPLGGTLVTPGINLWLGGLNRVLLNYDFWMPESGSREGSAKVQFQMSF
jgi:hypothetical protein